MKINLENNVDVMEHCPAISKIVNENDSPGRLCYFVSLWEYVRNKKKHLCRSTGGPCEKGTCIRLGDSTMVFESCRHLDKNYNFIVDYEMNGMHK